MGQGTMVTGFRIGEAPAISYSRALEIPDRDKCRKAEEIHLVSGVVKPLLPGG